MNEYHQYSALVAKGLSQPEIAARFGVTEKWVGQRLQLAKLAPELLKAWRAGKMNADQAAALSANADQRDAGDGVAARQGRMGEETGTAAAVGSTERDAAILAKLQAGRSGSLRGHGGRYSDDLFTEDRIILDPALLAQLVRDKLRAECERLNVDRLEMGEERYRRLAQRWHWPMIDITPWATAEELVKLTEGSWSEKARARDGVVARMLERPDAWAQGGVIVGMGNEGDFDYRHFMADEPKGDDEDDDEGGDAEPTEPEAFRPPKLVVVDTLAEAIEPKVNFKLREDMAEILSLAVAEALLTHPEVAMAALMATLAQQVIGGFGSRSPIAITAHPWGPNAPDPDKEALAWEAVFHEQMLFADSYSIGHLVGGCVDLRWPQYDPKQWTEIGRKRMVQAFCSALNPDELRRAIEERFEPGGVFRARSGAKYRSDPRGGTRPFRAHAKPQGGPRRPCR